MRIFPRAALLLCAFLFCLIAHASAQTDPPKIRIGVIVPLTGPLADAGETIRNSAMLAREAFDKEGRVEILIDDDNFNPQKTVTIAKRMIDVDGISGLIVFGSGTAHSVADVAEKARVPFIALALSEKITAGRNYVFRYFLSAPVIAQTIQEELVRRGYSAMALITSQQEGMISIRDALLALKHPEVSLQEEVLPNETDFKTLAVKIGNANAPVVVAPVFGFQAALLAKQLRAAKVSCDIGSGPTVQIPSVVKSADGALEGAWIATADDTTGESFFKRYEDTYHIAPVPDGTYAYDAVRLLIAGAQAGDIVKYLTETKSFTGIFGESSLGANHSYSIKTTIKVLKDGHFQKIR